MERSSLLAKLRLTGPTIESRSIATNHRSTGFDYLRIALALSIIVWHSFGVSYGAPYTYSVLEGWLRPLIAGILPMFFALSGYLVAGSLERTPMIHTFLGLRVLRIIPALAVEVLLSALLLGTVLTIYPLPRYFADPELRHYFLNILGRIHYFLPGMFLSNPIPGVVNGQLWTVPWELECYASLAILAVIGLRKRRWIVLVGVIAATVLVAFRHSTYGVAGPEPGKVVAGGVLVVAFLCGVAIYLYRGMIVWSAKLFFASMVVSWVLLSIPNGDFFVPFPMAYATVYLGLHNPRKLWILRGADYSYGLFLYGFVIQQSVARIGTWTHHWYVNLALVLPCVSVFAALSWIFIEKPALQLRKQLFAFDNRVMEIRAKRQRPPSMRRA